MTAPHNPDDWPFEPGDTIEDRFKLIRPLAKGSHGAVYVAESTFSGKRAAVKILFNSAKDYAERMRAEARALGAINHPNVIPIDDGGVTTNLSRVSGLVWFAMPFQDGPTLRKELDANGALPIERATRFLDQLASGCGAAHILAIIHRDLKPENVIVVSATDSAVILDFGVSKLSDRLRSASGLRTTERHRVLGTSEYCAPERLLEGATDARSDIYSLGLMGYEMFAGRHCFSTGKGRRDFPNQLDLGMMQMFTKPRPIKEHRPELPDHLATLIHRMLEKDPARRPQSMEEVATLAREFAASSPAATTGVKAASLIEQRATVRIETVPVPIRPSGPVQNREYGHHTLHRWGAGLRRRPLRRARSRSDGRGARNACSRGPRVTRLDVSWSPCSVCAEHRSGSRAASRANATKSREDRIRERTRSLDVPRADACGCHQQRLDTWKRVGKPRCSDSR